MLPEEMFEIFQVKRRTTSRVKTKNKHTIKIINNFLKITG